jgi:hypothetical protein
MDHDAHCSLAFTITIAANSTASRLVAVRQAVLTGFGDRAAGRVTRGVEPLRALLGAHLHQAEHLLLLRPRAMQGSSPAATDEVQQQQQRGRQARQLLWELARQQLSSSTPLMPAPKDQARV